MLNVSVFFFNRWVVLCYMYILLLVFLFTSLGTFRLSPALSYYESSCYELLYTHLGLNMYLFFFWVYPRNEIYFWAFMLSVCWTFLDAVDLFSKVALPFCLLPAMYEYCSYSTSLVTLGIVSLFTCSHSSEYIVVLQLWL